MPPEYVPEYALWLATTAERDSALVSLALVALLLVGAWIVTDALPERASRLLKQLFMLGGVPLYLLTFFSYWLQ